MGATSIVADGSLASTLVELLRSRAEEGPERRAYTFLPDDGARELSVTWSQLDGRVRAFAGALQRRGLGGERALLFYPSGLDFVVAFFGCLYAGVTAVPVYPPRRARRDPRLPAIAHDARAAVALTTAEVHSDLDQLLSHTPELRPLEWVVTDELAGASATDWRMPAIDGDTLAFLQYTSGSTSSPKGVMVPHRSLLLNLAQLDRGWDHTSDSVMVTWLPIFHDMGLVYGLLQPLFNGFHCVSMAPAAFLQRPLRWLQAFTRFRGTHSAAPNFAFDLCVRRIRAEERAALDLTSWRVCLNAAEPVREETQQRFREAFAPCGLAPTVLCPGFGLAEATLKVTAVPIGSGRVLHIDSRALSGDRVAEVEAEAAGAQSVVSCGVPQGDTRVVIVDPRTGEPSRPDQVGEIWASSASFARGYFGLAQATQETFAAHLPGDDGAWMRTGDLGFLRDGELYVTGRLKDLIIIRGLNYYPQDIELTVTASHPALRPDCAAAFGLEDSGEERLVLVCEIERSYLGKLDLAEIVAAARRAVTAEFELDLHALALLRTTTIPKTSSGKIQRRTCLQGFVAGSLQEIARWQRETPRSDDGSARKTPAFPASDQTPFRSLRRWIAERIAARMEVSVEAIDPAAPFVELGLNSVAVVELSGQIEDHLGRSISPTIAYDHPSIDALARYLTSGPQRSPAPTLAGAGEAGAPPIAVIGLACRFPGAPDPEAYWALLRDGVDAVREVPLERWDAAQLYESAPVTPGRTSSRWGGFIEGADRFDPDFFAIAPREAESMDPQQRLLLEVAWEALEHGGIRDVAGTDTGVFIGISSHDYADLMAEHGLGTDAWSGTGNALSIAANRLSYQFDLRGPSLAVDTACSSSLVAVHLACQSLRRGESSLALAGGVNLLLGSRLFVTFSQARMLAADGRCKTFDDAADGYVRGEGCGVVVLKRLTDARRDGDRVLAVIRGSAVNQDGASNGLTAPSGLAQQAVIRAALADAGLSPAVVSYVEAHGTGTPLGDPIEVGALSDVLLSDPTADQPCRVGSVKTNIGHLEAAAGIAGLIKVILALEERQIPPHLHLKKLNPYLKLAGSRLAIPTERTAWPEIAGRRVAGVSSFGFGGTNAHVIVESIPVADEVATPEVGPLPVVLSARDEPALRELAGRWARHLGDHPDFALADVCATSVHGRRHLEERLGVAAGSTGELSEALRAVAAGPPARDRAGARPRAESGVARGRRSDECHPVFLFTGQGAQSTGMGRELMASEPRFRARLERAAEILRHLEHNLLDVIAGNHVPDGTIDQTIYTQPALFALEYALADVWRHRGVQPQVLIGHSLGEYVAACVAGVFTFDDGLRLVAERARLMQALPRDGRMVAVLADEATVSQAVQGYEREVAVAAVNGPRNVVISGRIAAVDQVIAALDVLGVVARPLQVSHAFHSPLMDPVLNDFAAALQRVRLSPPTIDIVSNLTGQLGDARMATPAYWLEHMRRTVRFADSMSHLAGQRVFLEVGPRPILCALGQQILPGPGRRWLASMGTGTSDRRQMTEALVGLFVEGVDIDWETASPGIGRRIALPTYPFQRRRVWFEVRPLAQAPAVMAERTGQERADSAQRSVVDATQRDSPPLLSGRATVAPSAGELIRAMREAPPPARRMILVQAIRRQVAMALGWGPDRLPDVATGFFDMGMDSLMAVELQDRLEASLGSTLPATIAFEHPSVERLAVALEAAVGLEVAAVDDQREVAAVDDQRPDRAIDRASLIRSVKDLPEEQLARLIDEEIARLDS